RFPDDGPAFRDAAAALVLPQGGTVLDVGCGTGRGAEALRAAVGPAGLVVGVDLTPEMLAVATGKRRPGSFGLADVDSLPLRHLSVDGVLAAGLLPHVPSPAATLTELRRVTRPGGRLAVFHPIGRAALAARHGRTLEPGELLDPSVLRGVLDAAGWAVEGIDDGAARYLALARAA
ncbi:MAG TPA: methyltransferase domain-containing protein, partial [Acidimicrobiia bacterium]|nr:methyltransferase domain-containing protein [Acidimicrobiia bacterium]